MPAFPVVRKVEGESLHTPYYLLSHENPHKVVVNIECATIKHLKGGFLRYKMPYIDT